MTNRPDTSSCLPDCPWCWPGGPLEFRSPEETFSDPELVMIAKRDPKNKPIRKWDFAGIAKK